MNTDPAEPVENASQELPGDVEVSIYNL